MDIVVLEKKAFEQLLTETRQLTQRVELLSRMCEDKRLQKWLTSEDVCDILKISQRSLQAMRSKHKICYTQLGRKFYYRPEELELVIKQSGTYHSI
ncbi:MAG: helix-turn-helix domain-containing protein [Prevotella sp.]|nr:helix-turn-helix domain-containing protein [Prevotella sp.]